MTTPSAEGVAKVRRPRRNSRVDEEKANLAKQKHGSFSKKQLG